MTDGYALSYVARIETPYWRYEFGQSPLESAPAGNIPEGSRLCLQRPPTKLDALQSAFDEGVGRIIIRTADFEAA
jgi:hypothetical protein